MIRHSPIFVSNVCGIRWNFHVNYFILYLAGFVVGQAGLYESIAMFLVAYIIVTMTVLSVCAISTNGALDAGGAYCILQIWGLKGKSAIFNVCVQSVLVLNVVNCSRTYLFVCYIDWIIAPHYRPELHSCAGCGQWWPSRTVCVELFATRWAALPYLIYSPMALVSSWSEAILIWIS